MGTKGRRRGATQLGALLLLSLPAFLCGCKAARVQSNEARVEARPADAIPGVQDLVAEGFRQHQAGNAEGAIENYKAALAAWDGRDQAQKANVLNLLAMEYLFLGRWQEAVEAAKEAIVIRPDSAEAYGSLGFACLNLGRFQEASGAFQQAIRLKPEWAAGYSGLGEVYNLQGRFEDAIGPFERAIQLDPSVPQTHDFLGLAYEKVGRLQDAIPAYESAIRIKPDFIEAQFSLGLAYLALGRPEQALEPLRQTVRLKPDYAEAQASLGLALMQVGSSQEAVDTLQRAIQIKPDYAEAYLTLGMAYSQLGRFNESFEAGAEAYRLKPELAKPLAAEFRATEGAPEEPNDAVAFYNRQRQAANERGDVDAEAATALGLADAYDALGQSAEARAHLVEAVNLYRTAGNPQGQARGLIEIGRIDEDMGRYDAALASYHRAATLYRNANDQKGLAAAVTRLGYVYQLVGDVYSATQWYQLAVETSEAAGDQEGEIRALPGLLESAAMAKNQELAERYRPDAERALRAVTAKRSNFLSISEALGPWVRGQVNWGRPELAVSPLKFFIAVYRAAAPKTRRFVRETAADLYFLGVAYAGMQKYEEALDAFRQAADTGRQQWRTAAQPWIPHAMGSVREKQGKLDDALELYKKAVEALEDGASLQHVVEVKFSLRQLTSNFYDDAARVLLKLHPDDPRYVDKSFVYHDRGSGRTLVEVLNAGIDKSGREAPWQEGEKLSAAVARIQAVVQREKASGDLDARLQGALADEENALRARQMVRAASSERPERRTSLAVHGVADVQAILEPGTALLEYSLGEQGSVLWVVTKDTARAYELSAEPQITDSIEKYLKTLRAPLYSSDEHVKQGRNLYELLLGPAANEIQALTGLVVAPRGSLSYLPFETLIMNAPEDSSARGAERLTSLPYVGKSYTVSYVPSASVLAMLRRRATGQRRDGAPPQLPLLAFGDPVYERAAEPGTVTASLRSSYERGGEEFTRLNYSAQEVEGIAVALGVPTTSDTIYLREKATKRAVRELDLTRFRILHFAAHARAGDAVGWTTQPTLVLSLAGTDEKYDGFLQMSEILTLHLNADLVVLSACETAKGKMFRGDGIVGLTSAFLYAGSRSVVASLWAVNDQSTSVFMESFYRNLKEGVSKAEALRRARLQLMQATGDLEGTKVSYAAPYYWAPFILVGSRS
jgi:CHAT domain-containing protein/Flp pilus assembly protein TadD